MVCDIWREKFVCPFFPRGFFISYLLYEKYDLECQGASDDKGKPEGGKMKWAEHNVIT